MTTDFKASQVQTNKIIVTGSFAGDPANQLLVYSYDAQDTGTPNQGVIDPNRFDTTSGIGSDVFLFISGGISQRGAGGSYAVSVFGGDMHISGNLTVGGTGGGAGANYWFERGLDLIYTTGSVEITGSLSNGNEIQATGPFSHAEGYQTTASGQYSHAEGQQTRASAPRSHAEGLNTWAFGPSSHAEGNSTYAQGDYSHAEGNGSQALAIASHAEGWQTIAGGNRSHTEGEFTTTPSAGVSAHAEGSYTTANGYASHSEGFTSTAFANYSHSEGDRTLARGYASHAEGILTVSSGTYSHAEGDRALALGYASHAEGVLSTGSGDHSHAEGFQTVASGNQSHAEGRLTEARAGGSHAEGELTLAFGDRSHAEGLLTTSSGAWSHSEGWLTITLGNNSHAEGFLTTGSGFASHAEGERTEAYGNLSHAEGLRTLASGSYSHAEGERTVAVGSYSHAEGLGTISSGSHQHVQGKYNLRDNDFSLFVIGDGTGDSNATRGDIVRVNSGSAIGQGRVEVTGSLGVTQVLEVGPQSPLGLDVGFFSSGSRGGQSITVNSTGMFSGDLVVSGNIHQLSGLRAGVTTVTSLTPAYTASILDYVIAVSSSAGGAGVTLPAGAQIGKTYFVKDSRGNANSISIVVSASDGELIDGQLGRTISTDWGSIQVIYLGQSSGWGTL